MRILILIALLCNMAFCALYLNGAEYTQVVKINHSSVSETNGHFLFQRKIPRTGSIALSVDSANDVGITRINDTTRIPRWVVFTTDTIFLYADIAVSSTVDTSYRLQYGKALNEVNSSATFTNCGITNFWGFDESSGTTASDYANGVQAAIQGSGMSLGSPSIFGNGLEAAASGYATINTALNGYLSSKTALVISLIIRPDNLSTTLTFFNIQASATQRIGVFTNTAAVRFYMCNGSTATSYVTLADAGITAGNWYHLVFIYDGNGATNADRVKYYVNGVQKTVTFSEPPPKTTPDLGASVGTFSSSPSPYDGIIDQFTVSSTQNSNITTQYTMLFNPSTFSTLGIATAVTAPGTKAGKWSKYKGLGIDLKLF